MKKLMLILMVIGITIPALAVDISLVDNGNGTGTIQYTAAAGEVCRGIAIVVDAGVGSITAVSGINPEFNVYMDAAFGDPGAYVIGVTGTPIADPDGPGEIGLPASKISLCLGVVDVTGDQAGASEGTHNLATVENCGGDLDITVDTLRGGITGDMGDGVTVGLAGSVGGGTVTGACGCKGDADGSTNISINDLVVITGFLHPDYAATTPKYTCIGIPTGKDDYDANTDGNISIADLVEITGFLHPAYEGTTPKYTGPAGVCVP